jgi:hypothetical protein
MVEHWPAAYAVSVLTTKEVSVLVNRSMPPCTVIPVLGYENVGDAVDWLCETFGFTERWRAANHRAQLWAGDGAIAVTELRDGEGDKT